jgi:hypothetical protein
MQRDKSSENLRQETWEPCHLLVERLGVGGGGGDVGVTGGLVGASGLLEGLGGGKVGVAGGGVLGAVGGEAGVHGRAGKGGEHGRGWIAKQQLHICKKHQFYYRQDRLQLLATAQWADAPAAVAAALEAGNDVDVAQDEVRKVPVGGVVKGHLVYPLMAHGHACFVRPSGLCAHLQKSRSLCMIHY